MYPEVEEYVKTVDEARATYDTTVAEAQAAYEKVANNNLDRMEVNRAYDVYSQLTRTYERVFNATRELAWAKLGLSQDKLVSWIANNVDRNYRFGHADPILRILPATVAQMREVAIAKDWCNEFERLMDQGMQAGVVNDGRSQARKDLDRYLLSSLGVNRRYVNELHKLVSAVLEAEAPEIVKAQAEAAALKAAEAEEKKAAANAKRAATRAANKAAAEAKQNSEPDAAKAETTPVLVDF